MQRQGLHSLMIMFKNRVMRVTDDGCELGRFSLPYSICLGEGVLFESEYICMDEIICLSMCACMRMYVCGIYFMF